MNEIQVCLFFFVTLLNQQIEHTDTFYSHTQKVPSVYIILKKSYSLYGKNSPEGISDVFFPPNDFCGSVI